LGFWGLWFVVGGVGGGGGGGEVGGGGGFGVWFFYKNLNVQNKKKTQTEVGGGEEKKRAPREGPRTRGNELASSNIVEMLCPVRKLSTPAQTSSERTRNGGGGKPPQKLCGDSSSFKTFRDLSGGARNRGGGRRGDRRNTRGAKVCLENLWA